VLVTLRYRIDAGRLGKATRTPQGGIEVDGTIALSRVLEYRNVDGSVRREWYPPDEAKRQDTLDSLEVAAVTLRHPREMVTPANFRSLNRGLMRKARYDEATRGQLAKIVVQDAEQLDAIERGDGELSGGYHCTVDETPGTTPDGQHYDAIQRGRVYNHVGLGPVGWARAGASASLHLDGGDDLPRLDANGDCITDSNDPAPTPVAKRTATMVKIRIDGVDHEVGSDTAAQAVTKALADRDAKLDAATKAEAQARKDASDAQAKLDAEAKAHADTKSALVKANDPAVRAAEAASVAKLDADCKRLAPSVKLDGLDAIAKKKAALVAAKVNLDGKDDAYVASRFDAELDRVPAREDARAKLAATRTAEAHVDGGHADGRTAYDQATEKLHNRWKTPTAKAAVEG
jgi:hypothetical protein